MFQVVKSSGVSVSRLHFPKPIEKKLVPYIPNENVQFTTFCNASDIQADIWVEKSRMSSREEKNEFSWRIFGVTFGD